MSMKLQSFQGETSRRVVVAHSSSSQFRIIFVFQRRCDASEKVKWNERSMSARLSQKNNRFGFIFICIALSSSRVCFFVLVGWFMNSKLARVKILIEFRKFLFSHPGDLIHPLDQQHTENLSISTANTETCVIFANDEDFFCWFIDVRNYRKENNNNKLAEHTIEGRLSPPPPHTSAERRKSRKKNSPPVSLLGVSSTFVFDQIWEKRSQAVRWSHRIFK